MDSCSVIESPASRTRSAWSQRRGGDLRALLTHLARCWYLYLPLALALALAQHFLLLNVTASLPYTLVWLERGATPARGDLAVYRYDGEELMYLAKGQRFFKRIAGVPGDRISVDGRRVRVNDVDVGVARQYTLDGHRLDPLPPGTIPSGYYYMQGMHEMSFDSRYRQSGLVHECRILGTAHVIF